MPVLLDENNTEFPDYHETDEHGIIAVGGDLSPERILQAYFRGIFPWPHQGLPLLWFCPDPRFVLEPKKIRINRTLFKALNNTSLKIKADKNFFAVMKMCQQARARSKDKTWISNEMIEAYSHLHALGYAHSVEAYRGDNLVGGLYGISIGSVFFGESMFFLEPNASKIAFATLVSELIAWDFCLIDCQSHTHHLESFGAGFVSRANFLKTLRHSQAYQSKLGPWSLTFTPKKAAELIKSLD